MSRVRVTSEFMVLVLLAATARAAFARQAVPWGGQGGRSGSCLFGKERLLSKGGRLDEAERDSRTVPVADPQAGGAYANLGVV